MEILQTAISDFVPVNGSWVQLEQYLEQAFGSPNPNAYYEATFRLFERFPDDDGAGVFWSALHGMEAIGGYEQLLLKSFCRVPSSMASTMLRRILKSGQTHIGDVEIAAVLSPET